MAKLHLHQARALPSLSPQPPRSVSPSHLQFGVILVTDAVLTLVFIVQEPRGNWGLKSPRDCSEGEQLIGPHNVCDTASSRVSQGWDNLHHSPCGQGALWQQWEPGAPEDDAHWEHPCILVRAGEGFSGPFSIREPAGIPAEAGAGGLDGYQHQTPSANAFVAALNSLRCLCWRSRLGGGRVFLHLGAGETSPSMIFHLTSPCHICQLLLITEFAITLRTDVKGRKKRKRRLRDSTIINDVWQAKVPYNAL